jgi:hypothetical protein
MGQDARPALRWWQTRGFVAAMALIAAIPLLWPTIPPLVDLPGHMGRYGVQLSIDHAPWLARWYNFQWSLIGNLGIDLLIEPLAPIFGLELAVKLIVIAIPVLTVLGLLWIAREVHGRVPATALFALPLAYSFPFHFGFVNFALSMAFALCAFAWWLRLARQGRTTFRAIVFVPLSCAIWVAHTYGWGALGVLAFSAELIRQHDLGHRWFRAWLRAVLGCLPLALPVVLMLVWREGQHVGGETFDWFHWRAKVGWVVMILRDRWMGFDIACAGVLFLILFKGFRDPAIEYSRQLGLSALFLLAVFLILPRVVFGSAYADMRLAPFMVAVAIVALRPRAGLSIRGAATVAWAGLAFYLVRVAATTASFVIYANDYSRVLPAIDHMPRGAAVLTFVGRSCRDDWTMGRLEHLSGIALERKLVFSNDQWSMAGGQLLTTRYAAARGFAHDPSNIVTVVQCRREWWRPFDKALGTFPRAAFNYLWVVNPPVKVDPALMAGLVPVWQGQRTALYRIDHRVPPPVWHEPRRPLAQSPRLNGVISPR